MKTLPAGMQADLDSGTTTHCYCYKVVRKDGTIMGFTDHDEDLSFGSVTYEAVSAMQGTSLEQSLGLNVDSMEAMGAIQSDAITEEDIAAGLYDNSTVIVYLVNWTDVTKRVILMAGSLGEVSRSSIHYRVEFRSLSHYLNQQQGRVYGKLCDVDLGSTKCGVNLVSGGFRFTGVAVTAVSSSRRVFRCDVGSVQAKDSAFFSNGTVLWTTGDNNTFLMEIKSHVKNGTQVTIELWEPMPYEIQVGDQMTITAGCDKSHLTCKTKFNNIANFRGFPHVPGVDALLQIARQGIGGSNTDTSGGSRYGGGDRWNNRRVVQV